MTLPKRTWKRRNYLINRKFQFTLIGYVLGLTGGILLTLFLANLYLYNSLYERGFAMAFTKNNVYFALLRDQRILMNWIFLVVALLSILITCVWGIFISHRIAGPIYKIRCHLQDLAEKKTNANAKVTLRPNDFFPELAEAVNELSSKRNL